MSTVLSVVGLTVTEVESAQRGASFNDLAGLFWLRPPREDKTPSALKHPCQNLLLVHDKRTSYLLQAREVLQELGHIGDD